MAKSTIEFAMLAVCWSRQQHMAGAVTRSPVAGGGGGCVVFAIYTLRNKNEK